MRASDQFVSTMESEQSAVFCSRLLSRVNRVRSLFLANLARTPRMTQSLFDQAGTRKYLNERERRAFLAKAFREQREVSSFCLTLGLTGARLSEVLSLTGDQIDFANGAIVFRTLKRRNKIAFRAVPVPPRLLSLLKKLAPKSNVKLWDWGRTAAWSIVKGLMRDCGIIDALCKPKALRHGFAVAAGQRGVPLNIVQRWLGHARIETTAIYANALGKEERDLARRLWG